MSSPAIVSKYITEIGATAEEIALLRTQYKVAASVHPKEIIMAVFEVIVDGQARYCCWSGGELTDTSDIPDSIAPIGFSPAGKVAFQMLARLPFVQRRLAFIQLRMGKTPLREKVLRAFRTTPHDMMLCFFGDLAKELDGHMHLAFNVQGMVAVKDCIGITLPPSTHVH